MHVRNTSMPARSFYQQLHSVFPSNFSGSRTYNCYVRKNKRSYIVACLARPDPENKGRKVNCTAEHLISLIWEWKGGKFKKNCLYRSSMKWRWLSGKKKSAMTWERKRKEREREGKRKERERKRVVYSTISHHDDDGYLLLLLLTKKKEGFELHFHFLLLLLLLLLLLPQLKKTRAFNAISLSSIFWWLCGTKTSKRGR